MVKIVVQDDTEYLCRIIKQNKDIMRDDILDRSLQGNDEFNLNNIEFKESKENLPENIHLEV